VCLFPVAALLQRVLEPTGGSRLQVIPQQQQTPLQRDAVRQLLPQAEECWWSPGHIGWTLFDTLTGDAVQVRPGTVAALQGCGTAGVACM
jgi:hypothetical protein